MSNKRIEDINITQKSVNDFLNSLEGKRVLMNLKYLIKGYKPIKRTRKRQIAKAKHMMACHDQRVMSGHSGGSKALENRRGGRNEIN